MTTTLNPENVIEVRSDTKIEVIQQTGDDMFIAAAARISTLNDIRRELPDDLIAELEKQIEKDAGLINYLVANKHGSPFEHGFLTVRVETPIMVVREWFRHRIGHSYNEQSGRYTSFKPVFYTPGPERPLVQEGSSAHPKLVPGSEAQYEELLKVHARQRESQWEDYQHLLDIGIAKEIARAHIGVFIYTSFYASMNPRSMMHFLNLRTAENAQYEIRQAAKQLEAIFAEFWPHTYNAWEANGRVSP